MASIQFDYLNKVDTLYVITQIKTYLTAYLGEKVDKLDGYGLSKNDFSDLDKAKLDGIAEGATKVIIDAALNSSSENPVQNKVIKDALDLLAPLANPNFTGIPTAPTPSAGDDSTAVATTAYVLKAINDAFAGFTAVKFEFPDGGVLPDTGEAGTFYFIPHTAEEKNIYDEYVWANAKWELLGTTSVDLSNYVQQSDMVAITTTEIDAMFAGW